PPSSSTTADGGAWQGAQAIYQGARHMGLTRFAIQRPVAIAMLILAMVLMGVVAHQKLNVQLLPKIDSAAVSIITTYNGATAEDIEQLVTKQIEDAIATLGSIDYISSTSKEGVSQVL